MTSGADVVADAFECVNCGAAVAFSALDDDGGQTVLEKAACAYCDVVNDRALAMLRQQRAAERHEEIATQKRRDGTRLLLGATAAVVLLLAAIAAFNTRAGLATAHAEVERARAQVTNVRERQDVVLKRFAEAPVSPERDAEISGAENRVRIERARYDEVATKYNAAVGSPWARLCAAVFSLPAEAALSNTVSW